MAWADFELEEDLALFFLGVVIEDRVRRGEESGEKFGASRLRLGEGAGELDAGLLLGIFTDV